MRPFYENLPFVCIFLALLTGILTTLAPNGKVAFRACLALLSTETVLNGIVLGATVQAGTSFTYTMGAFPAPWGNELRAGPLEALLATLFCIVMLLSVIGGAADIRTDILPDKQNLYFIMLDMLLASLLALCYTNDLFTGYVFIEINTISACAIVMAKDSGQTIVATIRYLIMSLVGSGMFLFGVVILYCVTGQLLMPNLLASVTNLFERGLYHEPLAMIAGMMCIGLSVKSALFPFHTWLPDAHGSGTTTSSAVLSGVVLKGYIILMLKVFFRVFTLEEVSALGICNVLFAFGAAAMFFGSLRALRENHCKKMIAYSSVAQIGYVYLALGLGWKGGVIAAIFQILAHAVTKPLLFISAGGLIDASGHQKKLYYLRGAAHRNPVAGIGFTIGALSMVGVPLLAGFITKFSIAEAALGTSPMLKCALALGMLAVSSVLNALYYVPAVYQIWRKDALPEAEVSAVEGNASAAAFAVQPGFTLAVLVFSVLVIVLGCTFAPLRGLIALGVDCL
jgi:multicomponent Na+:H+ antiporter subunit D